MTPKEADDFIYSISAEGRSSASTFLDVAGASSFLTWLSRRHKTVTNPFRGTRARPKKIAKKELLIPNEAELEIIIDHFKGSTKAAVIVMAKAGLRIGALPSLSIRDGKYTCQTKGKQQQGKLTPEVLKALKPFGAKPFAERTAAGIRESVVYGMETLHEAGKIRARYSCHDLRHSFAVSEYRKDKDIYRVSQLLGHHNISITQTYLRCLGYGD
jgi:integrase